MFWAIVYQDLFPLEGSRLRSKAPVGVREVLFYKKSSKNARKLFDSGAREDEDKGPVYLSREEHRFDKLYSSCIC